MRCLRKGLFQINIFPRSGMWKCGIDKINVGLDVDAVRMYRGLNVIEDVSHKPVQRQLGIAKMRGRQRRRGR